MPHAPLWIFLAVYWATAVTSRINIGHRHVLPMYPVLFVLAGAAVRFWQAGLIKQPTAGTYLSWDGLPRPCLPKNGRPRKAVPLPASIFCALLLFASLGWVAVESLRTWPNYLTYFNQIAGGPRHGYRHLVDSSLDWGQDLPGLKKWLDENDPGRQQNVYLYYFGTGPFYPPEYSIGQAQKPPAGFQGRPALYVATMGLLGSLHGQGTLLAGTTPLPGEYPELPERITESLRPGVYCISATYLQGIYTPFRGHWTEYYEELYQKNLTFCWHYNHRDDPESRRLLSCFEEHDSRAVKHDRWRDQFVSSYHALRLCPSAEILA